MGNANIDEELKKEIEELLKKTKNISNIIVLHNLKESRAITDGGECRVVVTRGEEKDGKRLCFSQYSTTPDKTNMNDSINFA